MTLHSSSMSEADYDLMHQVLFQEQVKLGKSEPPKAKKKHSPRNKASITGASNVPLKNESSNRAIALWLGVGLTVVFVIVILVVVLLCCTESRSSSAAPAGKGKGKAKSTKSKKSKKSKKSLKTRSNKAKK